MLEFKILKISKANFLPLEMAKFNKLTNQLDKTFFIGETIIADKDAPIKES